MFTVFTAEIYGEPIKYNEVLTKARLRTFYKYGNRNGTYITDAYAEKLISTFPYTPVKGIFEEEVNDFKDHGKQRSEGRIYGVVPSDNNFSWEDFEDEDGITRKYACTDVLLYTGLYKEASLIPGKGHSMELYGPFMKGSYKEIDGREWYVYDDDSSGFLGLQVLGDDFTPCFQGSAFFSLEEGFTTFIDQLENYLENSRRVKEVFKFSDAKKEQIFNILNPLNENENEQNIEFFVCDLFEDKDEEGNITTYVVVKEISSDSYFKINYTVENEQIILSEEKTPFYVEFSEEENHSNKITEEFNEKLLAEESKSQEYSEKISTLEVEKNELQEQFNTVNTELETLKDSFNELKTSSEELQNTIDSLNEFKMTKESEAKDDLFEKYSTKLSVEVIDSFKEKKDEFTVEDLEKDLALALVNSDESIFSINKDGFIPKDQELTGIEAILSKYENNGGKN